MANTVSPAKKFTIRGRLSYPQWTHAQAVEANAKFSNYKKADPAEIAPEMNVLIEHDELERFKAHLRDVFIPYAQQQEKLGGKDALSAKAVKQILAKLDEDDFEGVPHLPIKVVGEKVKKTAPEAEASVKVVGNKGKDWIRKVAVFDEEYLAVPGSQPKFPAIVDEGDTTLEIYPGAFVAITLNLWAYSSSSAVYGVSAGGNTVVMLSDTLTESFMGGSVGVDEDDIFA